MFCRRIDWIDCKWYSGILEDWINLPGFPKPGRFGSEDIRIIKTSEVKEDLGGYSDFNGESGNEN